MGEGDSEQLVIPRIAEAMGVSLDPSFVPIVPLGGRYCTHFWRLLSDLKIPFATLLDFDIGRVHGGAKIIRSIAANLSTIGVDLNNNIKAIVGDIDPNAIDDLDDDDLWQDYEENHWVQALEGEGIFLSDPLDLDFAMLEAFPEAYMHPNPGGRGPHHSANALVGQKAATLKTGGDATLYNNKYDDEFRWYPYLFLQRSKPETHIAALTRITNERLSEDAPESLKSLIEHVIDALGLRDDGE